MTPAKRKAGRPKAAPKAAPMLTSDQLDQIKKKDIANLIGKVRQGKSLTAAERKILESAAGTDHVERELVSITRIAELFQVSRKTIYQWRNEGRQGVPEKVGTKEDVAAWRSWFAANPSAGHYDGKPRRDRETLLCEKLEVEIDIKKIELEVESGKFVSQESQRADGQKLGLVLQGMLLKMAGDLTPVLAGRPAGEVKKAIDKYAREKLVELSQYAPDTLP
jgi:predicted DNA-binding transcriptional regulator AlpA